MGLSPEVERIFKNYRWSGNVRELRNIIERASILEDGEVVTPTPLPAAMVSRWTRGVIASSGAVVWSCGGDALQSAKCELA